jgi:preprotein translocase subunit SecG
MISVFIGIGTVLLIFLALVLILIVLAQRASSDAGMSAMGGGMMESTFGPDTTNVLSKLTIKLTVTFFILSFLLYLGYVYQRSHPAGATRTLPNIPVSAAPASAPAAPSQQPVAPAGAVPTTAAPDAAQTPKQSSPATPSP